MACGCRPRSSTEQGTSTAAPCGRLSIRPRFTTLAWMVLGVPVTMEWMTCGAYSVALVSSGSSSPAASALRVCSYSSTFSALMPR